MRALHLLVPVWLVACSDPGVVGSGGGATTSTEATGGSGATTASGSAGAGGAGITLAEGQSLSILTIWLAPAEAMPAAATFSARVNVLDAMGQQPPQGDVVLGNGADDVALVYKSGQSPPYEVLGTTLGYSNVLTFDVQVAGEHGFGALDLDFPWVADFAVASPAVAANDIELTWSAAGATCSLSSNGDGGSYLEQDFVDEGHHTIPAGTLQPSASQAFELTCFKVVYNLSAAYVGVAQVHTTTSPVQ
jgi:hypothetical protein